MFIQHTLEYSPMEHQRPWNNLCSELLSIITSKCSAAAATAAYFGTVCVDWCRSLTKYSPIPPIRSPQPPFLLVPHHPIGILSLGKVVRLPFKDPSIKNSSSDPKLIELPQLEEDIYRICVSSSHGWLITLSEDSSVSLLNPVTQETIHLHPLSSINDEILSFKRYPIPKYRLSKTVYHSQFSIVRFAVLSSDPADDHHFTLMLFLSGLERRCFTSQGRGGEWIFHVHQLLQKEFEDVIFINGLFVTIDRFFELKIINFNNHKTGVVVNKVQLNQFPRKMPIGNIFLVNSDGHLLVVYTSPPFTGTMQSSIPRGNISVFYFRKVPLKDRHVKGKEIKKLEGVVLFLGHGCSVAVAVEHFPWLKEDTVYFTHDYIKLEWEHGEHRGERRMAASIQRAISIFQNNIRDRSWSKSTKVVDDVERLRYAEYWCFPRPFWVTPNLRRISG